MTASARRGPAYTSRQLSGAPFVDTRFVNVPTPIVPPLDLTRLNDASNAHNLQPFPRPSSTTVAPGRKLFHDTSASPSEINPMQINSAAPLREEHDRSTDPAATTTTARGDTNLDLKDFTKQTAPASVSWFQDPGLIHPKPPDIPVSRSKRDDHGNESLSARLARLAAGGSSRRVVPIEFA